MSVQEQAFRHVDTPQDVMPYRHERASFLSGDTASRPSCQPRQAHVLPPSYSWFSLFSHVFSVLVWISILINFEPDFVGFLPARAPQMTIRVNSWVINGNSCWTNTIRIIRVIRGWNKRQFMVNSWSIHVKRWVIRVYLCKFVVVNKVFSWFSHVFSVLVWMDFV